MTKGIWVGAAGGAVIGIAGSMADVNFAITIMFAFVWGCLVTYLTRPI